MAVTRINNNQISDASAGNAYVGINASTKVQPYSITATKLANNLTYGSDLTVTGNLIVQGNTTAIDTTYTTVEDPILLLASNQTGSPSVDIGFVGQRGTSDNIAFVWDESAKEFVTVYTTSGETNTTVSIASYADLHTGNANIGGNLTVIGTTTYTGNITGNLNVSGNIASLNLLTNGLVSATGNVTGGNLTTAGIVSATGNIVSSANVSGANLVASANLVSVGAVVSGNITGGNLLTAGLISATGNINGGNLNAVTGVFASTGYFTGNVDVLGNLNASIGIIYANSGIFYGNAVTGDNAIYAGLPTFTPLGSNVVAQFSGNVNAYSQINFQNVNDGTLASTDFIATANNGNDSEFYLDLGINSNTFSDLTNYPGFGPNDSYVHNHGGNLIINPESPGKSINFMVGGTDTTDIIATMSNTELSVSGIVTATGNVSGGNLNTAGQVVATGNVTGGNLNTAGQVVATGNVTGGNIVTAGRVVATGNIVSSANIAGGNLALTGTINTATIETTGNVLIGGNLTVQGNIQYINVDDLRVEDPIIIMGTGPNGAPLTTDDGMDRGMYMEWYKTGLGNSWIGWENSSGNLIAAADVVFSANNVVNVNAYGTFQTGNIYAQSSVTTGNTTGGNLTTAGIVSATGNIVSSANIAGANLVASANLVSVGAVVSGNVTGGNILTAGLIDATGTITSSANVSGANVVASANLVSVGAVVSGNVTGGNLLTAGLVSATGTITSSANVSGANVVASANLVSVGAAVSGNVTGGNLLTAGQVVATGNITSSANVAGANLVASANLVSVGAVVSGNITGGNLLTDGQVVAIGNITGGNLVTPNLVSATTVTATGNITGGNVNTSSLTLNDSTINSNAARITVNSNSSDVDFAVNSDTVANVFYVDAGTGTVSVGSATQTTNAILAMNATNSFLMPVGNTAQRPGTGVTGMLRFNSTTNGVEVYNASEWATVGTPSFTIISDEQFNGDGINVAFTLSAATTTNSTIVSINGIVQIPTIAYSVGGVGNDELTFTEAPENGDVIDVRILTTTTEVVSISNSPGNAIVATSPTSAIVEVTGDLIPTSNVTFDLGSSSARWNELWLAGNTIALGTIVIKDVGSNQIGFFQADGTTPATIDSNNVDTTTIANGTSSVSVIASNGNISANVGGSTVGLFYSGGANVTGVLAVSGNIVSTGSNGVANIGSATTYFNTVHAKATSAQYADLAEVYAADAAYEPGTVVSFGGESEVTVSAVASDARIAGVISTNPSYVMNATLNTEYTAVVALTGRVPTKVSGPVSKGDMIVSAGNGRAMACVTPAMGTVIGKALENHVGGDGVIEVVVGRL